MTSFSSRSWPMAALVLTGLCTSAYGAENAVTVKRQGLCVQKNELKCEEAAVSGTTISFSRLPLLSDGKRGIYFYSELEASAPVTMLHLLESEDSETAVNVVISDALMSRPDLEATVRKVVEDSRPTGSAVVQVFEVPAGRKAGRVFSEIHVEGPGIYSGRMLALDGSPHGKKFSVTVTREAPAKTGHSSTGPAYDIYGCE